MTPCYDFGIYTRAKFRGEWRVYVAYPKNIHACSLANYTLLEMLDVFNLYVAAELYT